MGICESLTLLYLLSIASLAGIMLVLENLPCSECYISAGLLFRALGRPELEFRRLSLPDLYGWSEESLEVLPGVLANNEFFSSVSSACCC